jgi:hypothetical protein
MRNRGLGSALHEQAGEVLPVTKGQDAQQNQDDESEGQSPVVQEQMIYEDVGDYRAKKSEPQWDVAVREQEQAAR